MWTLLRKIKWYLTGRPMLHYRGYNCGLCGQWINEPFSIPTWKSVGKWGDTWGICPIMTGCQAIYPNF